MSEVKSDVCGHTAIHPKLLRQVLTVPTSAGYETDVGVLTEVLRKHAGLSFEELYEPFEELTDLVPFASHLITDSKNGDLNGHQVPPNKHWELVRRVAGCEIGVLTEYPEFDSDAIVITEFTHSCCARKSIERSEYCAWHSKNQTVSRSDLIRSRGPPGEFIIGASLSGMSLKGINLSNLNFIGGDFEDINFRNAELHGCNLPFATFSSCRFDSANLNNADLSWSFFNGGFFWGATVTSANLERTLLFGTSIYKAEFSGSDFTSADLIGVDASNTKFINCDFAFVDVDIDERLQYVRPLDEKNIEDSRSEFKDADFSNSAFVDATLTGVDFEGAKLSNTVLTDSRVNESNLRLAELSGTDLRNVNLTDSTFYDASVDNISINDSTQLDSRFVEERRADKSKSRSEAIELYKQAVGAYRIWMSKMRERGKISEARHYYFREREVRRKRTWLQTEKAVHRFLEEDMGSSEIKDIINKLFHSMLYSVSRRIFGYGEKLTNVVVWSTILICSYSIFYATIGKLSTSGDVFTGVGIFNAVLRSLYFSVVTFTTLGYGDISPASSLTAIAAMTEAVLGAIFVALFVFVLGRRATW